MGVLSIYGLITAVVVNLHTYLVSCNCGFVVVVSVVGVVTVAVGRFGDMDRSLLWLPLLLPWLLLRGLLPSLVVVAGGLPCPRASHM